MIKIAKIILYIFALNHTHAWTRIYCLVSILRQLKWMWMWMKMKRLKGCTHTKKRYPVVTIYQANRNIIFMESGNVQYGSCTSTWITFKQSALNIYLHWHDHTHTHIQKHPVQHFSNKQKYLLAFLPYALQPISQHKRKACIFLYLTE